MLISQEKKSIFVRDFMTKKVISVSPESLVMDANKIILEHGFSGLPVVDNDNRLIGIITEYDIINKTSDLSASFFEKILSDIRQSKGDDRQDLKTKSISDLTVAEIMNKEPLVLEEDVSFEKVVDAFREHGKVNPIPIVNKQFELVGIISRSDILKPLNTLGYAVN